MSATEDQGVSQPNGGTQVEREAGKVPTARVARRGPAPQVSETTHLPTDDHLVFTFVP